LSTLTKVLIVLLTISSIFLCGIVVTYVANAENYRQMYNRLRVEKDAAEQTKEQAVKDKNKTIEDAAEGERKLKSDIADLETQVGQLNTKLTESERQKAALIEEAGKWKAITRDFYDTNDKQRQLLEDTLAKLKTIEAEQIQSDKEIKDTTAALIEKMAIIDDLEKQSKQLLEEKTALQNRLNQLLQQAGKAVAAPERVTTVKEKAQVALPTVDISLNGLISAVDLENSLAEISIGAANGVKQNMRFHVTRADKFICDIVILDVEPEKAIGTLELMDVTKEQPQAGDNVSTNL
jgi:DNA repair exonuclease SbcCD ATPase subunit